MEDFDQNHVLLDLYKAYGAVYDLELDSEQNRCHGSPVHSVVILNRGTLCQGWVSAGGSTTHFSEYYGFRVLVELKSDLSQRSGLLLK
jgi:hypothetical protein